MDDFKRDKPLVSIIIPSWFKDGQNGKYGENETIWFAWECLHRLMDVTPKEMYELIIIDNGSDDIPMISKNWIDQRDPRDYFRHADVLIQNKKNLGFAPACNQGFGVARGKYIVCLNNDILVWPNWLQEILVSFQKISESEDKEPGVVMPALMKETRDANEALEIKDIDLRANFNQFGKGAEFGSLWVMTRKIMEELKRNDGYVFDENFKVGFGEDRDLWDRVRGLGYETYRTHRTRVFHQGNMSMSKIEDRRKYTTPNREYLAKKRESRNKK